MAWALAWRFLRGRRSRLLAGTARAALVGCGLGVAAMVVAMALMTGYQEDLQRKLTGGNAAVLALPLGLTGGGGLEGATLARLTAIEGVDGVARVVLGQGSLSVGDAGGGDGGVEVTLRGVEPGESLPAGLFRARAAQLAEDARGLPGAVLGDELARRLGLPADLAGLGEGPAPVLRLVALGMDGRGRPRFRYQSLRFAGTFTTGFAEFDRGWMLLDRQLVTRLVDSGAGGGMYEVTTADLAAAPRVAGEVEAVLGEGFLVTNALDLNRELFAVLRLQKLALFLVLGLIVFVSTFNVASTLVVAVRERMREIGVLAAMGLRPAQLRATFLLYGTLLGGWGILGGLAAGAAASWMLGTFELIRFDAEVAAIYFISSVPFRIEMVDLLAIAAFAQAVTLLACVLPAWRAARVVPAAALRYE